MASAWQCNYAWALALAMLAPLAAQAQSAPADTPVMTETAVVALHAVRTGCAADFPALKTKLDEAFAKLRQQHKTAFEAAQGSADFEGRVDRMRASIDARRDRARYEAVCVKLSESEKNWR